MDIRVLTSEEIESSVKPDYVKTGNPLPDPTQSVFLGAFDSGVILGYLCLQLKLHAQPLRLFPGGEHAFAPLVHGVEDYIREKSGPQWVYLFAPEGKLTQMAKAMGMVPEPWTVLSKHVGGDGPKRAVAATEGIQPIGSLQ